MVLIRNRRVEHENGRDIVNGFPRRDCLISLASATPSLRCCVSLDADLKNLRKGDTRRLAAATRRLLWGSVSHAPQRETRGTDKRRVEQVIDKSRSRPRVLAPTVDASNRARGRGREYLASRFLASRLLTVREESKAYLIHGRRSWRYTLVILCNFVQEEPRESLQHDI